MINFSVNKEYFVGPEFTDNFEEEYKTFTDTHGTDSPEDFLLYMLEFNTPEELGASEEYSETVVF